MSANRAFAKSTPYPAFTPPKMPPAPFDEMPFRINVAFMSFGFAFVILRTWRVVFWRVWRVCDLERCVIILRMAVLRFGALEMFAFSASIIAKGVA